MLRLANRLPQEGNADAIYVPGLCVTYDRQRLTSLNSACMEEAMRYMRRGVKHLVFSGAYSGRALKQELVLRRKIVEKNCVRSDAVREIHGIVDTYDELTKLALVLKELGAKSVLFVSDEYHMPRLVLWARSQLRGIELFHVSVRPSAYEFPWEPNLLKVFRFGVRPLWILWNVLFYILTPLLLPILSRAYK